MSKFKREFKNVVYNYTDAEAKVREATSNDPWGPSGAVMSELAEYTYHVQAYGLVMGMLWKRLNDHGKNWRHVYKSLVLLDYLIKSGSERVTAQCKDNIFSIQTLKDFQYIDKEGKDQGANIREKAKALVALLKDDERLKDERKKAQLTKQRQAAISSTDSGTPKTRVKFADGSKTNDGASTPSTGASSKTHRIEQNVEQARPTDTSEEEMQLKLALQLSKQQADQEAELKSREEESLAAAIALSKQEAEESEGPTAPAEPSQGDNLLLDFSETGLTDPWSNTAPPPEPPPSYDTLVDPFASTTQDPFAGTTPTVTSDPFAPSSSVATDPFASTSSGDVFGATSSTSSPWSSAPQPTSSTNTAPVWVGGENGVNSSAANNPFDLSTLGSDLPPLNNTSQSKAPQTRIEDQFLGSDFGNLVDLDSLTIPPPILNNPNPFGGSATTSSTPANPFESNKPPAPSLVQMANSGFTGSELLPAPMVPLGSGSPQTGRAQPNPFS